MPVKRDIPAVPALRVAFRPAVAELLNLPMSEIENVPFSLLLILHGDALTIAGWSEHLKAFTEYLGLKRTRGSVSPKLDMLIDDVCTYALKFNTDSATKNLNHSRLMKILNELGIKAGTDKTRYETQRIVVGLYESVKKALSPEIMTNVLKGEDVSSLSELEDALTYFICYAAYAYLCFAPNGEILDKSLLITAKDKAYMVEFANIVQRLICETPESAVFFNN